MPISAQTAASPGNVEELRITGLTKGYLGVQALKGVDLTVRRGSIHALAGQNGAGKSTLVKMLSGAEVPDSGTIALGERVLALRSPPRTFSTGTTPLVSRSRPPTSRSIAARDTKVREVAATARPKAPNIGR